MAEKTTFTNATQVLEPFRGVKKVTLEEYFTSGHRTCQGCESALVMKLMVKAAGPRTIVLGSTGCMYVANTTYYTTPWVVPWMHTQLGSSGSAALGTAPGLNALMRKGRLKDQAINGVAVCGCGGRHAHDHRKSEGPRRGRPPQAGPGVPPQAGALRPLHRGGPRVFPGEGGRDVAEVGDSGGHPVPPPGRREGGARAGIAAARSAGRREDGPGTPGPSYIRSD